MTLKAPLKTVRMALKEGMEYLNSQGIPSPRLEAEVLLAYALQLERLDLYTSPERPILSQEETNYQELLRQRGSGIPTAYLRGKKEFFSRTFSVGPGVLIPRAETELLVEESLRLLKDVPSPHLLELGTGSGAILISVLAELPDARGTATELSPVALQYAKDNAETHGVKSRITFYEGDLFFPLPEEIKFDLIVSNPPYIPTNQITSSLRFEPREAVDGGEDGLKFYEFIFEKAWKFMKPQTPLLLETSEIAVQQLLNQPCLHQYTKPQICLDLAGRPRALMVFKRCRGQVLKNEEV